MKTIKDIIKERVYENVEWSLDDIDIDKIIKSECNKKNLELIYKEEIKKLITQETKDNINKKLPYIGEEMNERLTKRKN